MLDALKQQIVAAFADVERPGDWALIDSTEGEEPRLLRDELTGKGDWRSLDAAFLDQLPDGYGSALSFFSDEAFRHFLPGYLIADLDGLLRIVDPTFHLVQGLDVASRDTLVNPRRYGARTWLDAKRARFSTFTANECSAIVAYLEHEAEHDDFASEGIREALDVYWRPRAAGTP